VSQSQGTVAFGAGCRKSLAWFALSWAAVAAGLYALFQMRYESEPARNAALVGGGLVILLSGFFTRGLSRAREAVNSLRSGAGAGLYSAETGGFVNDADRTSSRRLRLVLGGRNETTSALWKQAAANLVGGAFLIAFVLGLVLLFLEKEAGPKESVLVNVFDAVGKDDAALATRCIEAQTLNLNLPGGGGKTPLVLARSAAMTKLLLKAGADANRKDLEGTTPLVSAVRRGDSEATKLLLAAGANPNEPDAKKNRTPLDWALETRSEEIAEILREAGARSEP
jgi:Ankyrin repeats (3 copies)